MVCILATVLLAVSPLLDESVRFVNTRLEKAEPSASIGRFLNYPANAARECFVPNPEFWLKGVDFSCASTWNGAGGKTRAGTAISKRHIIFSGHFPLWTGVRILFVGEDGGVCPCTVKATQTVGNSDIVIGLLDAELTPNIRPAKVLPEDFGKHIGDGGTFPVVTFNQDRKALLTELVHLHEAGAMKSAFTIEPFREKWREFRVPLVVGDSGCPAFILIGGEPVLIYCVKVGGCGHGPAIHAYRTEIQGAMDALCPGYRLETFDFRRRGK